jgi:hypothetical protein
MRLWNSLFFSIGVNEPPTWKRGCFRGYRGFGGIYDIGLKGAFRGYIGLLLNAPYKRDSMMG